MQKILNLHFVDNSNFYPLCQAYISLVSYWNTRTNLVSSRDVDNLLIKLIHQSVVPLASEAIPHGAKVLDVGSGAGLPGLPLKFARPDLNLTLLEPQRNKSLFLQRAVQELGLDNVEVVRLRIEDISTLKEWRSMFDLITTRATGSAPELFPLLLPLVKTAGVCWFYKGATCADEAKRLSEIYRGTIRLLPIDRKMSVIIVEVNDASYNHL